MVRTETLESTAWDSAQTGASTGLGQTALKTHCKIKVQNHSKSTAPKYPLRLGSGGYCELYVREQKQRNEWRQSMRRGENSEISDSEAKEVTRNSGSSLAMVLKYQRIAPGYSEGLQSSLSR